MQWTRRSLPLTVVGVVAATACSAPAADRAAGTEEVLRVAGPFELHSLQPVESSGLFTRLEVTETLVSSDLEGELVPGLATGWTTSRDGLTWSFDLPADAEFHDGTPVTADAVAASLQASYAEEASPLAAAPVGTIAARDDAVRIELEESYPALPAVLTHFSTAVLAPAAYDDGRVTEVIGTGPYEVESVELPARVDVTAFEEHRDGAPAITDVEFQAVGRAESRALLAASDQAEVVFGLEPAGRERVDAAAGVGMVSSLQPRSLMMKVNVEDPVLGDLRVRRALSQALDREAMADAVLRESELAATQLFPASLTAWHRPDLEPLAHDPRAARDLLAQAGWTPGENGVMERDGRPLRLTLTTYPDRPELPALATAIQGSLEEVGFDVDVDVTSSSEIPVRHGDGSLQLGLLAKHLALVTDPLVTVEEMLADGGSDWGAMGWRDDEVAAAIDELEAGTDDAAADADRALVAETLQRELPLVPVAWYRMNAAVSERVEGFVMDPLERTWHLSEASWAS